MAEKKKQVIGIGSDHAGFRVKEYIKEYLKGIGDYEVEDFGTRSEESADYPDYAHPLAQSINKGLFAKGIVVCSSGNGVNMTVNKYPFVRSALCWNEEITKLARLHNDANILALPGNFLDFNEAVKLVDIFLKTGFEGGRHKTRVEKIPRSQN